MTNNLTSTASLRMADLYQRLAKIGLSKKYLQDHILPPWWTEEVDQTPGTVTQGALYLSRRLNLDLTSLFTDPQPRFTTAATKFKTQDSADPEKLLLPQALALGIAELAACACPIPYQDINHLSVSEIRQQILSHQPAVNLTGLLDFCWNQGIPVLHLNRFPSKVHCFHGMVAQFQGRPAIVISLNDKSPARLLFVIAHELGHILRGHLAKDSYRIDTEIQLESESDEENEANQIAAELLLGQPGISYDLWSTRYLSAETLIRKAQEYAPINQAEPGVIALNIAWNRAHRACEKKAEKIAWATGKAALKTLEPQAEAPAQINQMLQQRLTFENLSDDNQDYLATMLQLPPSSQ